MGYVNPLLSLPTALDLAALPAEQRAPIVALLRDLRNDANQLAEACWKRRREPMAPYWRAVATCARHTAHALAKAPTGGARRPIRPDRPSRVPPVPVLVGE